VGGTVVFARHAVIRKGTLSGHSAVPANDTFYWLGDDGRFYDLDGANPRVISEPIRRLMEKIMTLTDCYGLDFVREHVIRWFFPSDGKCIVYDYARNRWSLDGRWTNDELRILPINSYMEHQQEALIASREPDGLVHLWDFDYESDDTVPIRVARSLQIPLTANGTRARVNRIRLRVKRGYDQFTGTLLVRWRIDRGKFTSWRSIDLGPVGSRDPYIDLFGVGIGRELHIEFVESEMADTLLTDLTMTVEELE
jgi:hypothetical protein